MVTLAQIKAALKIDYTTDDAELIRIRDAVMDFISEYTGVSIEPTKNTQYLTYWMRTRLIGTPFLSVTSVKYTDTSGTVQTMPSTDYFITKAEAPSIYINFSEFPDIKQNTEIEINYDSGYGALPRQIEQAIIAITGAWYNNPEATAPISIQTVPMSAQFILEMMREKNGVLS